MNLPSQIEEKEKTLTELMARVFNEPLRPLAESLQQTGLELKSIKTALTGLSEGVGDTLEEVEDGNRTLERLLTNLCKQDMSSMRDSILEIETANKQVSAALKTLAVGVAGTEERLNDLSLAMQQGQNNIRAQYLALQVEQQSGLLGLGDALTRQSSYCEAANEAVLVVFNRSAADQMACVKTLQSTVDNVLDATVLLGQQASEESTRNREDMDDLAEKYALLEVGLIDVRQDLRTLTKFVYVALVLLVVLIGCQLWSLIQT